MLCHVLAEADMASVVEGGNEIFNDVLQVESAPGTLKVPQCRCPQRWDAGSVREARLRSTRPDPTHVSLFEGLSDPDLLPDLAVNSSLLAGLSHGLQPSRWIRLTELLRVLMALDTSANSTGSTGPSPIFRAG